jgi:pyridoxamine 5'-phosphate oxidase
VSADPFDHFRAWYELARSSDIVEPSAMSLATCTSDGRPSLRTVLLRGFDPHGFVFFTNYESRKAEDVAANPQAALLFYWGKLSRQIRIEGPIQKVTAEESDAYFVSRPRGHRLSAWASEQSRVIRAPEVLEERMRMFEERFPSEVPRPPHWGGYRVTAERFEFWEGRLNRLHDRIVYRRHNDVWSIERLAP